jgi:hypothetical protein
MLPSRKAENNRFERNAVQILAHTAQRLSTDSPKPSNIHGPVQREFPMRAAGPRIINFSCARRNDFATGVRRGNACGTVYSPLTVNTVYQ